MNAALRRHSPASAHAEHIALRSLHVSSRSGGFCCFCVGGDEGAAFFGFAGCAAGLGRGIGGLCGGGSCVCFAHVPHERWHSKRMKFALSMHWPWRLQSSQLPERSTHLRAQNERARAWL
eukprot:6185304-Pleurochrysis_carterae.AAC.3